MLNTYTRAVAALCVLCAMVVDNAQECADAQANLREMSAAEIMSELASWKDSARMMPEWRAVLRQHGFM